jgi:hypothetical protein
MTGRPVIRRPLIVKYSRSRTAPRARAIRELPRVLQGLRGHVRLSRLPLGAVRKRRVVPRGSPRRAVLILGQDESSLILAMPTCAPAMFIFQSDCYVD